MLQVWSAVLPLSLILPFSCPWQWAPLLAQMVKNLPTMQETWLQSLGWEDPLEKEMAAHSSTPAWRVPGQRSLAGYSPRGRRVRHDWATDTCPRLFSPNHEWPLITALDVFGPGPLPALKVKAGLPLVIMWPSRDLASLCFSRFTSKMTMRITPNP